MEYGDWIKHDGGRGPTWTGPISLMAEGTGSVGPPDEIITPDFPGFFWRWKRVRTGWFRSELRRVCDDPTYAPVIAYRFPRSRHVAALIALAADPPPLSEPEKVPG